MLPDPRIKCPHTGFAKTCKAIVSKYDCPKFVKIDGHNPNTGEPVHKTGCIDSFLHLLLIENSQQQRQTGAAVESARNAAVKAAEAQVAATQAQAQAQAQATEVFVQSARAMVAIAAQTAQLVERLEQHAALPNGAAPARITHQQT